VLHQPGDLLTKATNPTIMKIITKHRQSTSQKTWIKIVFAAAIFATAIIPLVRVLAQSVPQPVLTLIPTNGTQLAIAITNAVASTNYEIYRTPLLGDPSYPWELHSVGTVGQSNFVIDIGIETSGFFKAGVGSDWDLDGSPNSRDANPSDPNVKDLTITIDSPTNGASIN
jgi:hypothetical protein